MPSRRSFENRKFLTYCLYAFGGPALVACLVYITDNTDFFPEDIKIGMGVDRCWIKTSETVERIYVFIPISVVIVLNTAFYSITAYKINQVWRETAIIREADSSRYSEIDHEKTRSVEALMTLKGLLTSN